MSSELSQRIDRFFGLVSRFIVRLLGYPGNQDAVRSFPEAFQSQAFAREPSATVEKMWSECQRCELMTVCFWTFLDLNFGLFVLFFI